CQLNMSHLVSFPRLLLTSTCSSSSSISRLSKLPLNYCRRNLFSRKKVRADQHTPILFGEVNERGGYAAPFKESLSMRDWLRIYKRAWLELPESYAELRNYHLYDRVSFKSVDVRHGDYYYIGYLSRDGGHHKWIVTADSHYGEGYSTGEFIPSSWLTDVKNKAGDCGIDQDQPIVRCTGLFRGVLDTRVPQTGQLVRAGYVNLRSPYALMIKGRARGINLQPLNCIVIRYRGDGRRYRLNLHRSPLGKLDYTLFDIYSFPLYTRGGPYWTVAKIPVSKLIRTYKGRVQDRPILDDLSAYSHLSITLCDGIPGPFSLELDYVAAFYDATLNEKFAYEIYPVSSLMKKNISW
ncbi:hypothetical protein BOX15_Mlig023891g1, partial [Macrostomum lignano]